MAYRYIDYRLCCRNPYSKGSAAYDSEQAPHSRGDDPVVRSCPDCRHGSTASPGAAVIGWTCRSRGAFTRIDCSRASFPNRFSHKKPVCHRHCRDPDFGGAPLVFLIKYRMVAQAVLPAHKREDSLFYVVDSPPSMLDHALCVQ